MEVRQSIDDLHGSLSQISAEDNLLKVIAEQLTTLRRCYPSHKSSFTSNDIAFLKGLGGEISDRLQEFIELKEELPSVSSLMEYEDIVSRLSRAKGSLASYPVAKRIAKEIRELNERLPAIRQQDETKRQYRIDG